MWLKLWTTSVAELQRCNDVWRAGPSTAQQAIQFSRSEIKLSVDNHAHFTTIMAIGELIRQPGCVVCSAILPQQSTAAAGVRRNLATMTTCCEGSVGWHPVTRASRMPTINCRQRLRAWRQFPVVAGKAEGKDARKRGQKKEEKLTTDLSCVESYW